MRVPAPVGPETSDRPAPVRYEATPGAASQPLAPRYQPRNPRQTALHQIVRDNLLSFLADGQLRTDDGQGYPLYVEKELRDFVACGDLSRGFARLRCKDCGFERLLPFSCKNRGICPSCTTRRMNDEAAYLVDVLLPAAATGNGP